MESKTGNGWDQQALYVRKELERLSKGQDLIFKKMNDITVQIAMLKVKSGVWGLVGACIPISLLLLIEWARG